MDMEQLLEKLPSVPGLDTLEKLRSDLEAEEDLRLSIPAPPVMSFFSDCVIEDSVVQGNQIENFNVDTALPQTLYSEPNPETSS